MQNTTPHYLHLAPGSELPELKALDNFKAVLVADVDVADTVRWDVSRWLMASGCKYALAWGKDAELWRESLDDAHLEATNYDDVADAERVITTAHDDEELDEVFWFARHRATHPAHPLRDTLIVHLADASRREELEQAYRDA